MASEPYRDELIYVERTPRKATDPHLHQGVVRIDMPVLDDPGLSFGAKGIYAFMCTVPPGKPITFGMIMDASSARDQTAEGTVRVWGYITELVEHGYIDPMPRD